MFNFFSFLLLLLLSNFEYYFLSSHVMICLHLNLEKVNTFN